MNPHALIFHASSDPVCVQCPILVQWVVAAEEEAAFVTIQTSTP